MKLANVGLIALALLAATAVVATAAQASSFHVEAKGASITGGYPKETPSEAEAISFKFKTGGIVPCLKASFSGSVPVSTVESLTLAATLSECIAWTMTMGKCDFVLHTSGTLDVEGGAECAAKPIEVEPQLGCRIRVGPQQIPTTVSYANSGSGSKRDVTATFSTAVMHYTQMNSTCSGGISTFTNGKLTGIVTLRADQVEGGTQQGLWVE